MKNTNFTQSILNIKQRTFPQVNEIRCLLSFLNSIIKIVYKEALNTYFRFNTRKKRTLIKTFNISKEIV